MYNSFYLNEKGVILTRFELTYLLRCMLCEKWPKIDTVLELASCANSGTHAPIYYLKIDLKLIIKTWVE